MELATFWNLIDQSRRDASGDADAQLASLRSHLAKLGPEEVVDFDLHFSQCHDRAYTWDLWAAAYVIGGGCSDDGFTDFRAWLISRGKRVFEAALLDADSLVWAVRADDGDCQLEELMYVASDVWEQLTGRPADEFPQHSFPRKAEPDGERWDEDDLADRLPDLSRKFGD